MGYVNMKFAILLSLVACTLGAPSLPRLPLRVLLNGDAPLEGSSVGIVGGQFMLPFELPFLVSVQFESFSGFSHGCGGSVYNKDFIVDAAHCFPGVDPSQVRVVASEYLLSWNSGLEQIRSVKKINMHPKSPSPLFPTQTVTECTIKRTLSIACCAPVSPQVVRTRARVILAVPSSPAIRSRWSESYRGATDVPMANTRECTPACPNTSPTSKASPANNRPPFYATNCTTYNNQYE